MKNCLFALLLPMLFAVASVSCSGRGYVEPERRIKETLPDRIRVEYNNGSVVYAKDGNWIYAKSGVYSMQSRGEVVIKENLSNPAVRDPSPQLGNDQYYISSCWVEPLDGDGFWRIATSESHEATGYDPYHANDHNHSAAYGYVDNVKGSAAYLNNGYSDVNSELSSSTVTQKENETVDVGGQDVECKVFEYVFEHGSTYSRSVYYFAASSGVYIKSYTVYGRDAQITEDRLDSNSASYYKEGETLDVVLEAKDRLPKPDYSAFE